MDRTAKQICQIGRVLKRDEHHLYLTLIERELNVNIDKNVFYKNYVSVVKTPTQKTSNSPLYKKRFSRELTTEYYDMLVMYKM